MRERFSPPKKHHRWATRYLMRLTIVLIPPDRKTSADGAKHVHHLALKGSWLRLTAGPRIAPSLVGNPCLREIDLRERCLTIFPRTQRSKGPEEPNPIALTRGRNSASS